MKFTCDTCQARYQIPDEKVAGRKLKYVCRKCDTALILDGTTLVATPSEQPTTVSLPPASANFAPPSLPPVRAPVVAPPAAVAIAAPSAPPPRTSSLPRPPELPIWHVAIDGEPQGPMRISEVRAHLEAGRVDANSLAWRDGQPDWMPLGDVPALAALLAVESAAPLAVQPAAPLAVASAEPPRASVPPPRASVPPPRASVPPTSVSTPPTSMANPPAVVAAPAEPSESAPSEALPDVPPSTPPEAVSSQPRPSLEPGTIPMLKLEPGLLESERGSIPPSSPQGRSRMGLVVGGLLLLGLLGGGAMYVSSHGDRPGERPSSATAEGPPSDRAASDVSAPSSSAIGDNSVTEVGEDDALANALAGLVDAGTAAPVGSSPSTARSDGTASTRRDPTVVAEAAPTPPASAPSAESPREPSTAPAGPSHGELTREAIRAVYQRNQGRVQSCYDRAATMVGNAPDARLQVAVQIQPSGQVGRVSLSGNDFGGLGACIQRVVQTWQFPVSDHGAQTTFPFVFSGM